MGVEIGPYIEGENLAEDVRELGAWQTFGPKRVEVADEWRKIHNEKLYDLYSSQYITQVIKSIRMRWTGHVACMGETCVQGLCEETWGK